MAEYLTTNFGTSDEPSYPSIANIKQLVYEIEQDVESGTISEPYVMKCKQCGKCCSDSKNHSHACVLSESDLVHSEIRKVAIINDHVLMQYVTPYVNGKCPFLKDCRCLIHEIKPESCSEYFCSFV